MKRFRYARDSLFLIGCFAYALNRWVLKPRVASEFLHSHFNDLWLIPCALPLVLWIQRRLSLRTNDAPPTWSEIWFHVVIWSILFEGIGPYLAHVTGDPLDVLAYIVGGLAAGLWWNRRGRA